MRDLVRSAFVQDAVSRVSTYIFSKCEEKASTGGDIERLEMAHSELELALERTGKLPITDVSLLRRRKILKRAFEECSDVLHKCKILVQEDEGVEQGRTVMHSFPQRIAHATKSSIAYLFATGKNTMCCSHVGRFEWLADCAGKFVRDVESGCSLRHHTFRSPLLRQLLEGKTLGYKRVQKSRLRKICIWPIHLEERGIEAILWYEYEDYKTPEKSFKLRFMLRLSESTNIIGNAIKCLRHLASQFKLVAESAMGELTLLSDLHDICYSDVPPWVGFQKLYTRLTQICRPDPICCNSNGHETCATNITSSELSNKLPEEVISISLDCIFHISTDDTPGRNDLIDRSSHMCVRAGFAPHAVSLWERLMQSYGTKIAGRGESRVGSVEQQIEMIKSMTCDRLVRQQDLVCYMTFWQYVHGFAFFQLRTPGVQCMDEFEYRFKTHRIAKRRR
ncbi:hypothetical protein PR202_ga28496 [Eleusine coracana subsp. coracana]|uniref:Uncharacterized protein n=1 Tax=Eleusine coracana subsp. coracana TaxID=191504 RepID=A0AAV5DJL8_ELECO|nr:hypothetical protein QOZ80_7AG0554100 [Eleusine coracana subsp. coracana]GJN10406.1 hypothetical protein PR202_ga28496 [Eleusine coracana subsp. coracana]